MTNPNPRIRLIHYEGDWIEIYIDGKLVHEGHETDVELGWFAQQITGEESAEDYRTTTETCQHKGCTRQGRLPREALWGINSPRYCHIHRKERLG